MIRFLFRFIGLICLAAAFMLVIVDGMATIANKNISITSVRAVWELMNVASLRNLETAMKPYASGLLWDPMMVNILAAPACALLGGFGILLLLLGRRKKPLIGYAR